MSKLRHIWGIIRDSLWFVPGSIVVLAIGAAVGLIEIDSRLSPDAFNGFPRLFGAGASGSRGMLVAVATSMVTVAGVAFSITLVALSLASSQYSPRVLRNFMADRTNQAVLGAFVGIFAYCLVVLRTIREGEASSFVPSLAVLGGAGLALVGIGLFIYFIHHIASSIQASHILARIARDTTERIDHLFPEGVGHERPCSDDPAATARGSQTWHPVPAERTGYIQRVDPDALFEAAGELDAVIRMEASIGEFIAQGRPVASVLAPGPPTMRLAHRIASAYSVGPYRTTDQDPGFGIRQLVDIALKGLSPGINDTTTAVMALDYLTAILVRLSDRSIESPCRFDNGNLRVITRGPTFEGLVDLALDQIRQHAGGNVAVLGRMLATLELLADTTAAPARRRVLLAHARSVEEAVRRTIPAAHDRDPLAARAGGLMRVLGAETGDPSGGGGTSAG
jgi:uncharacterized membrane protein